MADVLAKDSANTFWADVQLQSGRTPTTVSVSVDILDFDTEASLTDSPDGIPLYQVGTSTIYQGANDIDYGTGDDTPVSVTWPSAGSLVYVQYTYTADSLSTTERHVAVVIEPEGNTVPLAVDSENTVTLFNFVANWLNSSLAKVSITSFDSLTIKILNASTRATLANSTITPTQVGTAELYQGLEPATVSLDPDTAVIIQATVVATIDGNSVTRVLESDDLYPTRRAA